jgi:hypothetical protein
MYLSYVRAMSCKDFVQWWYNRRMRPYCVRYLQSLNNCTFDLFCPPHFISIVVRRKNNIELQVWMRHPKPMNWRWCYPWLKTKRRPNGYDLNLLTMFLNAYPPKTNNTKSVCSICKPFFSQTRVCCSWGTLLWCFLLCFVAP